MTASAAVRRDDGAEGRAAARMSGVGALLGAAFSVVGMFLAELAPEIAGVVLLGYGLILGAIFGAVFGLALYRARAEGSPEVEDLQRFISRED